MRILLLGAGFTHNWGGWLASEMMGELCGRVADDPHLLRLLRKQPNFEVVLGEVRQEASRGAEEQQRLLRIEQAVRDIFDEMNEVLAEPASSSSPTITDR